MAYQTLLEEIKEGIYTITINRPDKLNALNQTVMEELASAVQEAYGNDNIKSVLLTGSGEKAFVAGADIREFLELSPSEGTALSERGQRTLQRIEDCPKPFVAAVNGFALGGGCELAMACHFRLASTQAKFGQPEVNLGLIPGYGGTQRLTRLVGRGRALELMMTGEMISAEEAMRIGLVNQVLAPGELINTCRKVLLKIQSKAPLAIRKLVHCVNASFNSTINGFETERLEFGDCFNTGDMKEGATAFVEKRKPEFKGK
ncbi:MAG TPA: enoyl-CoA hydratase-related protein [Chitinophagaceae bacterium]|jgi:enoyl-CoA hydratase|nr:enoyl-CoA hydratase-related protein [Chitinophagaceae bacterium]